METAKEVERNGEFDVYEGHIRAASSTYERTETYTYLQPSILAMCMPVHEILGIYLQSISSAMSIACPNSCQFVYIGIYAQSMVIRAVWRAEQWII